MLEAERSPGRDRLRPRERRADAPRRSPPLGNAALARWLADGGARHPRRPALRAHAAMLQRLPTNAIHTGRRYRYLDTATGQEKVGVLRSAGGGWYTFDNDDATAGRARGAANVIAEVGAVVPQQQQLPTDETSSESESSSQESMEEDVPRWSFGGAIRQAASELGITDHVVLSVVIELTQQELNQNKQWGTLPDLLTNPRGIASCMKTAQNLVALFVTGGAGASAKATRNDPRSMAETTDALCSTIRAEARNGILVNITYGIHGFVVVAWGNHAELLQSFAGFDEPATLGSNFANPRTFDVNGVCQVLAGMAGPDAEARKEGQTAISGDPDYVAETVLEDEANTWPNVDFQWVAYRIASADELLKRVVARMTENITKIPRKHRK